MEPEPELASALSLFDASQTLYDEYVEQARSCAAELRSLEEDEDAEELFRHLEFMALSHKFHSARLSFEAESLLRSYRPEAKFFTPLDFEKLVQLMLWYVNEDWFGLTRISFDQGIDLFYDRIYTQDGLCEPIAIFKTIVQCKLYRGTVPVTDVRDFAGVMLANTARGYFFTTSTLTSSGYAFARKINQESTRGNALHVIDGTRFTELLSHCNNINSKCWDMLSSAIDGCSDKDDDENALQKLNEIDNIRSYAKKLLHTLPSDQQTKLF